MRGKTRGYIDIQDRPVTWRGLRAVYSVAEQREMRGLPAREALVLHTFKAFFGGEIMNPADAAPGSYRPRRLEPSFEHKKSPDLSAEAFQLSF